MTESDSESESLSARPVSEWPETRYKDTKQDAHKTNNLKQAGVGLSIPGLRCNRAQAAVTVGR